MDDEVVTKLWTTSTEIITAMKGAVKSAVILGDYFNAIVFRVYGMRHHFNVRRFVAARYRGTDTVTLTHIAWTP
jgi:hypothetical protein